MASDHRKIAAKASSALRSSSETLNLYSIVFLVICISYISNSVLLSGHIDGYRAINSVMSIALE